MSDALPNTTIYSTLADWKLKNVPFNFYQASAQSWLDDLTEKNLESKGMWKYRKTVVEIYFNKRTGKLQLDFSGVKGYYLETSATSLEVIINALTSAHYSPLD